MVIEPELVLQVVGTESTATGNTLFLTTFMVSRFSIMGPTGQDENLVLTIYCVTDGPGQILGKLISSMPGTVVAVSASAITAPPISKSSELK